jgi:NADH/NAD ratio-sensing transcriptional regulator Rex
VPEIYIPQLSTPNAVVAIRANVDQLDEIVLDLEHEAPTVTIARDKNATSAAEILATGQPAQAVIVAFGPIGMKTPEGVEVQAFKLTVMPVDGTPYQVDVGKCNAS